MRWRPRYTYPDYVGVELYSNTKHEFLDGGIYALCPGSMDHSALAAEVLNCLGAAGVEGCCAHTSALRLYVESIGLATYPDGSVIRGGIEQHPPSPRATALNPLVLLEVTSAATEDFDTTTKLEAYRSIPSLRDYIIVSHRERRITVHSRGEAGWTSRVAIGSGRVVITALPCELVVDEIYRRTSIR